MTELWTGVRGALPSGVDLAPREWWHRHRVILVLLVLHLPVLFLGGLRAGWGVTHLLLELAPVALAAAFAATARVPRRVRGVAATLGLLACSAILVHLSGGVVEAHFHFFVVVAVILLYHDWWVFLAALGFVLLHHGVVGVLDPGSVYNHAAAQAHPVRWAGIHAAAIAAMSAAGLVNWRFNEGQRARADAYARSLRGAYEELQRAVTAKDDLLSRVSHELRTPLTVVNGFAQALLEQGHAMDRDAHDESARAIVRNAARLEGLIQQLLAVSRLEDGTTVPRPVDVTVDDLLADALTAGGAELRPHLVEGGATAVHADRRQLTSVLVHLLTNAHRYGDAPVTLSARSDGAEVELVVADGGAGVPPSFVPRLFGRFEQASTGDRRDASGMGLGLYLVRALVETNRGRVAYEPGEDGGARFVVRLPAGSAVGPAVGRAEARTVA